MRQVLKEVGNIAHGPGAAKTSSAATPTFTTAASAPAPTAGLSSRLLPRLSSCRQLLLATSRPYTRSLPMTGSGPFFVAEDGYTSDVQELSSETLKPNFSYMHNILKGRALRYVRLPRFIQSPPRHGLGLACLGCSKIDVTITPASQSLYIGESNIRVRNSNLSSAFKAPSWSHCERLCPMDEDSETPEIQVFKALLRGIELTLKPKPKGDSMEPLGDRDYLQVFSRVRADILPPPRPKLTSSRDSSLPTWDLCTVCPGKS